jgi:hypothetical protein
MRSFEPPVHRHSVKPSKEEVPSWIREFHKEIVSRSFQNDARFEIGLCDECGSTITGFKVWLDLGQLRRFGFSNPANIRFVVAHEMGHIVQKLAATRALAQPPFSAELDAEIADALENALMHAEVEMITMYLLNSSDQLFPATGAALVGKIMTVPANADSQTRFYLECDSMLRQSVIQLGRSSLRWR